MTKRKQRQLEEAAAESARNMPKIGEAVELPDDLSARREALWLEIAEAFDGVTRMTGVSWGDAEIIDFYGSDPRGPDDWYDKDRCWQQLVDEPKWEPDQGVGGWTFLDAIGSKYYLPAGMMKCLRRGHGEWLGYALTLNSDYQISKWTELDFRQRQCVKQFLLLMVEIDNFRFGDTEDPSDSRSSWHDPLESNWDW